MTGGEAVDPLEVLGWVRRKRALTGAFEVYRVSTFEVVREAESGEVRDVTVRAYDEGPGRDPGTPAEHRYSVELTTPEGHKVGGRRCGTVAMALSVVRWHAPDRPPKVLPTRGAPGIKFVVSYGY